MPSKYYFLQGGRKTPSFHNSQDKVQFYPDIGFVHIVLQSHILECIVTPLFERVHKLKSNNIINDIKIGDKGALRR